MFVPPASDNDPLLQETPLVIALVITPGTGLPFNEQFTEAIATSSVTVPIKVNVLLVSTSPEITLVTLTIGLLVSTKLACNIKLDAIKNVRAGFCVTGIIGLPLIAPVQFVNTHPGLAVAVME